MSLLIRETNVDSKPYYIAGPMTGYPEFNVPAFRDAQAKLEAGGIKTLLPFDIDNFSPGLEWGDYLGEDIKLICKQCRGIILLPEWERSRGAKLEVAAGLMQSLKYPEFEFKKYLPSSGTAIKLGTQEIALAWYDFWDLYSKEARVAA